MADKDYSELTSATAAGDTDLVAIYPVGGPLKKLTFAAFIAQVISGLGSGFLLVANSLSDVASASAARANLGLGTAAQLASSALFQVANNFSEVANAATARTNIGAAAADAPTITSGMTYSGATKYGVQALAGNTIDLSLGEMFTRTISVDSTFIFTNAVAAKGEAFTLKLTISGGATPTWPSSVKWSRGVTPTLGDGTHRLGFLTDDGGTTWSGFVGTQAQA